MNRLRWISAIVLVAAASVTVYLAAGLDIRNIDFSGVNWDLLRFSIEYPDGYTKEYILESAEPIEDLLLSCDGVEQVSSRYERERVSFFVQFCDAATRKEAIRILMREEETLGDAFLHFPEATAETSSFSLSIAGTHPQELQAIARQLAGELQELPYCRGVLLHFKKNLPAKQLRVDLQKAAQAGIAPGVLRSQIYWALSSPVLDKWTTGREEMDIRLQTGDLGIEERNLSALLHLPCGELPLGMLVQLGEKSRTGRIYHMDRSRSVSLSVLSDQEHRRELISASRKILAGFSFPSGYRGEIGKEVEEQHFLSRALFLSLFLAVLLIFFILMFQFESLRVSGLVILQIPGAFICPLLLLKLLSWPLSLPVVIGLILTSGIAVNNGILIFVELHHSKRMTVHEVLEALGAKLKPLLLSSATTIVGIAPLMLSGRVNRGILAPLSITVAAGIAGSIGILIATLSIFAVKE
jgi:HAE1 family hydrophobic/amphiphilic exporter-1